MDRIYSITGPQQVYFYSDEIAVRNPDGTLMAPDYITLGSTPVVAYYKDSSLSYNIKGGKYTSTSKGDGYNPALGGTIGLLGGTLIGGALGGPVGAVAGGVTGGLLGFGLGGGF